MGPGYLKRFFVKWIIEKMVVIYWLFIKAEHTYNHFIPRQKVQRCVVPALSEMQWTAFSQLSTLKIRWPWDWADSPSWGSHDGLCDEHLGFHRNLLYFPNLTLCSQMHLSQSSLFSPLCKNEVFGGLPHTAPHSSIFACEWDHRGLKGKVQLSTVCSSHRNLFTGTMERILWLFRGAEQLPPKHMVVKATGRGASWNLL